MGKTAIILGSAPCAAADLRAIPEAVRRAADIIAVGVDALALSPLPIKYITTYHPEDVPEIKTRCPNAVIVAHVAAPGVDVVEPYTPPSGSSALCGALFALRAGYERIILCGCPLTGKAKAGNDYAAFREGWEKKKDLVAEKVRSMSGWTKTFLGAPPQDWLRAPAITICCIKQGDKYDSEYVNRLYRMVRRHAPVDVDFLCYTDDAAGIDLAIRTEPLLSRAPGWWQKISLFRDRLPGVETDRILFLDLDVVIVGDLSEMIGESGDFIACRDWPPEVRQQDMSFNSSVFLLRVGSQPRIWSGFDEVRIPSGWHATDQEWITTHIPAGDRRFFPYDWTPSYKLRRLQESYPPEAKVILFHGRPKPHECGGWVKDKWR
jgi:hypothetical protein